MSTTKLKQSRLKYSSPSETEQNGQSSLVVDKDNQADSDVAEQDSVKKPWVAELRPYFKYESTQKNNAGRMVITMACKLCPAINSSGEDKPTTITDKTRFNFARHLQVT